MAPLIARQAPRGRLGRWDMQFVQPVGAADRLSPASQTSVYTDETTAVLEGGSYRQISYVWCYGRPRPSDARLAAVWQGVRMTLDSQGFPMVWEAMDDREGTAVIFVSKSLEASAIRAFGSPLPRRRFAIERSVEERPQVVVARLLEDGPEPMGPFVYVDQPGRYITTILCRCMPSQYSNASESVAYRVERLANQPALGTMPSLFPNARDAGRFAPDWLDRALRLPPQF